MAGSCARLARRFSTSRSTAATALLFLHNFIAGFAPLNDGSGWGYEISAELRDVALCAACPKCQAKQESQAAQQAESEHNFIECDTDQLVAQIGVRNLMAISGRRVIRRETGVTLPVDCGYSVTVDLDGNDTYVVRRELVRGTKGWVKGERTNVYCEELGDVVYYASCFRSYDAETWPTK